MWNDAPKQRVTLAKIETEKALYEGGCVGRQLSYLGEWDYEGL